MPNLAFVKYTKLFILLLFLSAILPSCSIEKRLYNKGFHVENNFLKKEKIEKVKVDLNTDEFLAQETTTKEILPPKFIQQEKELEVEEATVTDYHGCDTLYFKNGSKILCNIKYVSEKEVFYKFCGNDKGNNIRTSMAEIESINYASGEQKEVLNEDDYFVERKYLDETAEEIQTKKKSLWSFLFSIFGILFYSLSYIGILGVLGLPCFILAVVLGRSALKTYKENPQYQGKGYALAGFSIGLSMIILTILAAILIFLIFLAFII